jgi:threonine dehydrogenase-like Zn-dependent dehydrogenase
MSPNSSLFHRVSPKHIGGSRHLTNERIVRGAVMYVPGDVRVEARLDPMLLAPTDAIIRLPATCICGSDLWPHWGIEAIDGPRPMAHDYVGLVEEVGSAVTTIRPG